MEVIQVQTTLPARDQAERLAATLVEQRLAACVQVLGPLTSTYRWQGAVERADEWLCLIKTTRGRYARVESAIQGMHPYDVPEIVATEITDGSEGCLRWIAESVSTD